jgi:YidC/Oxa1 family membrane protein insertase
VATVFGLPVNPLIIAWTALMIVQQKLTPTTMDPMQAKVMLAMPLVMVFVLYNLPAALTLYWTVSQIFSIAQMLYQNKVKAREEAARKMQENEKKSDKPKTVRS